ncbi:hypothetical protein QC762_0044360 [Podospora pseudocomata]|uniref:Uncharacterized protein n=3 Tax=Podospora TaxID=5144 RepID=A0ABR0GNQ1_9PEZI|nr:hypothetical protein QC761_0044130 [Podospora bellae-mahoneyi]KAK4657292.1 hypothetical protein QC762_0044360 [Podospora pseudocomata]KAK4680280.1 hypothetical protein QC764_0043400 [Podospora pseudoanserina]
MAYGSGVETFSYELGPGVLVGSWGDEDTHLQILQHFGNGMFDLHLPAPRSLDRSCYSVSSCLCVLDP